ncbi:LysM peptidoglycan-binding domain-containing protein [Salipiger aestuarii]|uniref:LysM peptidoglycan-binding domain-containing protein n=1 Tax=Salipiger aestuarii TaxID=568098 RepID=UPI0012389987|nr:LysM peptidoglycan-binding domain-containing protein [Salipiger aestuarii]KAA8614043.1 hypothetical protein AL037_04810 [Salipiger aestuarii]
MDSKLLGWGILGAVAFAGVAAVMFGVDRARAPSDLASPQAEGRDLPVTAPSSAPPSAAMTSGWSVDTPTPPSAASAPLLPDSSVAVANVPPSDPAPPSFDLVRADPDGMTLVAGNAPPGAIVSVLIDGVAQATGAADDRGRFAHFLDLPPDDAARVLTLRMSVGGREIVSTDEVLLAAPPRPLAPQQPVPPQALAPDAVAVTAPTATASPVDAPPAATPRAPASVAFLSTEDGVALIQPAVPPLAPGDVAIDAITYDTGAKVALSGRGRAGAQLRVYLDNRSVATATVPRDGRWRAELPQIDAGTYTLRVDQMGVDGDVTARAESPFLRESPAKLAAVAQEADAPLAVVTVQPGHTLWALARDRYGDGFAYVKVFEANRSQIRDADLIYPGQVFDLPD